MQRGRNGENSACGMDINNGLGMPSPSHRLEDGIGLKFGYHIPATDTCTRYENIVMMMRRWVGEAGRTSHFEAAEREGKERVRCCWYLQCLTHVWRLSRDLIQTFGFRYWAFINWDMWGYVFRSGIDIFTKISGKWHYHLLLFQYSYKYKKSNNNKKQIKTPTPNMFECFK